MFVSRGMRLALLISFFCHLLCMSFISIVFLPSGFKLRQYSSVYFLGSILRDSIAVAQSPINKTHGKFFAEFPSKIDIRSLNRFSSERVHISSLVDREIPNPDSFIDLDEPQAVTPFSADIVADDAPFQREVIFQPPSPEYPEWMGSQELRASSVIFKIYISADGMIEQIVNVQGSGNPEIDVLLARYVRRWRFAPVREPKMQCQTLKMDLDFE